MRYNVRVHPSGSYQIFNPDGAGWSAGHGSGSIPVGDGEVIDMPSEAGTYTLESYVPKPPDYSTLRSEPDLILGIIWSALKQCEFEYDLRVGGRGNPQADFEIAMAETEGIIEAIPDGRHRGKIYRIVIQEAEPTPVLDELVI